MVFGDDAINAGFPFETHRESEPGGAARQTWLEIHSKPKVPCPHRNQSHPQGLEQKTPEVLRWVLWSCYPQCPAALGTAMSSPSRLGLFKSPWSWFEAGYKGLNFCR